MKGIDVSVHQGQIDWNKVRSNEVEFAILRAGYGMYENQKDPTFEFNYSECNRVGILVGAYWYSYATTVEEAEKEAEVCLKILDGRPMHLPVWFDQEYEPGIKDITKSLRTQICLAFMKKISKAGYRTGLYCSYDWYTRWVDASKLTSYLVWIAQYAAKCRYEGNNLAIWQYTSTGRVGGVGEGPGKNVDLDAGYTPLYPYIKQSGWTQIDGAWYWLDEGKPIRSQWVKDKGFWYYLNFAGKMLTGLQTIKNKTYYLNEKTRNGIPMGACVITDESGVIL